MGERGEAIRETAGRQRSKRPAIGRAAGFGPMRLALAAALAIAGGVHLLVMPQHMAESAALGVGFFAAAALQLGLAVLVLLLRPRPAIHAVVIGSSAILMTLYAANVVAGFPLHAGTHAASPAHGAADGHAHAVGSDHGAHGEEVATAPARGDSPGAGEPVDAAGLVTQAAQLAAIALAAAAWRGAGRRPASA